MSFDDDGQTKNGMANMNIASRPMPIPSSDDFGDTAFAGSAFAAALAVRRVSCSLMYCEPRCWLGMESSFSSIALLTLSFNSGLPASSSVANSVASNRCTNGRIKHRTTQANAVRQNAPSSPNRTHCGSSIIQSNNTQHAITDAQIVRPMPNPRRLDSARIWVLSERKRRLTFSGNEN